MSVVSADFWNTVRCQPTQFLQELYDAVIAHSEKRMPRWKFRLAPDLILQVQPQLTRVHRRFVVTAMQADGLTGQHFSVAQGERPQPWLRLSGSVTETQQDSTDLVWALKLSAVNWSRKYPEIARDLAGLRARVIAAFEDQQLERAHASVMLLSSCIICGKALTDPVSKARFIGPECAGTASVDIPWVRSVDAELPLTEVAA